MILYIVIGVLVVVVALASVAAFAVGILSLLGGMRLQRCSQCRHLYAADLIEAHGGSHASTGCPFCRHTALLHPLASLHHPHTGSLLHH